jgi:ATP-dependent Clp protease adaptor protein ClpS
MTDSLSRKPLSPSSEEGPRPPGHPGPPPRKNILLEVPLGKRKLVVTFLVALALFAVVLGYGLVQSLPFEQYLARFFLIYALGCLAFVFVCLLLVLPAAAYFRYRFEKRLRAHADDLKSLTPRPESSTAIALGTGQPVERRDFPPGSKPEWLSGLNPLEVLANEPLYQVVLLNDDDHSFTYVINMLQQVLGYSPDEGYQIAYEVHSKGRAVIWTTSLEWAERVRERILALGPDPAIPRCQGPLSVVIEPATR